MSTIGARLWVRRAGYVHAWRGRAVFQRAFGGWYQLAHVAPAGCVGVHKELGGVCVVKSAVWANPG